MIKGFRDFIVKNNVLALAVAVIVGGAVGKVVSSLVADILMPLISLVLPEGDWRTYSYSIGKTPIKIGDFFGNVVDFFIIALVVYVITRAIVKEPAPPVPAPSKVCPRCKESIAVDASKCKFCTADV